MSDLIDRKSVIDVIHKAIFDFFDIVDDDDESPMTYKDEQLLTLNKAIVTKIKALPSADAVEVVRCKDCKHRYVDGENVRYNVCELNHNKVQSDDWYCADGKRNDVLGIQNRSNNDV